MSKSGVVLERHFATSWTGEDVELHQWRLFYEGRLIGYLPWAVNSRIQPICGFPYDIEDQIAADCSEQHEMLTGEKTEVLPPFHGMKDVEDLLNAQESEED